MEKLTVDELAVLQALIVHHKAIKFCNGQWIVDIAIEKTDVINHTVVDHTVVTSLRNKQLITRKLGDDGKPLYVVNEDNEMYADVLKEMRTQKALGVEEALVKKGIKVKRTNYQ